MIPFFSFKKSDLCVLEPSYSSSSSLSSSSLSSSSSSFSCSDLQPGRFPRSLHQASLQLTMQQVLCISLSAERPACPEAACHWPRFSAVSPGDGPQCSPLIFGRYSEQKAEVRRRPFGCTRSLKFSFLVSPLGGIEVLIPLP